jgi:hypothetical protein
MLAPQTGKPPPPLTPHLPSLQTRPSLLLLLSLHRADWLLALLPSVHHPCYCFV